MKSNKVRSKMVENLVGKFSNCSQAIESIILSIPVGAT